MSYTVRDRAAVSENLGRRFGETEALSGLDLTVAHGKSSSALFRVV
jgi:hypothetical protein